MANIDGIGLAEPSTITKSLASIRFDRNSTVTYQEVMCLGSPNSTTSLALAEVLGTNPASTVMGLAVRSIRPTLQTFASTAGTSTVASLVSSNATGVAAVSAFTVTSTESGPIACGFYSGSTLLWPVTMWAAGGAIQVSLAVGSPGYLFVTSVGSALTFNMASTGSFRVAVTYSTEA